jgi:ribonuclease E
MCSKIFVNAVDPDECRVANIQNNKLEEFHIERATKQITRGNIYKGIVTRVEPSLQAVFIDYGEERHGFLQKNEIHSDYFKDNPSGDRSIQNLVERGQEMIVQVTKDPFMKKGAMLTTNISLPGRHVVLMPGSKNRGISRKIEKEKERARIKEIIEKLKMPEDFGLIVRTAGTDCTKTIIDKDITYLMRLWKNIKENLQKEKAPVLLYKERSLVVRSIRDYFVPDVTEILIDNENVFREAKEFIKIISPKHTNIVKFHKSEKPIFTKFNIEDQIASIYKNKVLLKSGGSIVISPTEALVAIDVNSGKSMQNISIEQTALHTNLEAVEEIARQLRLRDLGGLIVLDLIDMRDVKHKIAVEKAMKTHLKKDKAKTKIGKISLFGLMEMSRQRIQPTIESSSFETCCHCKGKGQIPSSETLGLGFLRKLNLETLKNDISQVNCMVPPDVAFYLLNKKKKEIYDLENRRGIHISIAGDPNMVPGDDKIMCS